MRTESKELLAVGLFGSRSNLRERIETLLRHTRVFSPRASAQSLIASTLALAAFLLAASLTPRWIVFAQSRPSFEVASVKLNTACEGDRQDEKFSPGRVSVTCITLSNLIQAAYGRFGQGPNARPSHLRIAGAPAAMLSSRYDIAAKARGDAPMDEMFGPMLRTLLEDRFRLSTHKETRQLPVYALTAGKSGARLQRTKEGDCTPVDLAHSDDPAPNFCGMTGRVNGVHVADDARGMSLSDIAGRMLANRLDRPVIDRTGLTGLFNAHLEFDRDAVLADDSPLSIFTAVQEQLGLKLSPDKGPVEVLVIDHVEPPDAN